MRRAVMARWWPCWPGTSRKVDLDDVGPEAAIGLDHALDDGLLAPARECIVAVLGEAEIEDRIVGPVSDPGDRGIEHARRLFQFARSHHAKAPPRSGPMAFCPPSPRVEQRMTTCMPKPIAQRRQQAAMLIVRMGAGVHHR